MTNHWIDIGNTDVTLIIGSNAAENHPISFRYVQEARDKGGKLIVVDPRMTRSASIADLYASIRPGTDLAFMGGMINYALQNDRIQKEYVVEYTNASFLINPQFRFHDGLFSGYNARERKYDNKSWGYQLDDKGVPKQDKSLNDPNCVYQLMKKHYSRYTPEEVEAITGCPKDTYLKVCELFTSTYKNNKVSNIMYAMGTTQHTVGTQNVRSYAIIQTLLGNIGMAGGGINALRGEANVQGSTDMALLWHILPGYLPAPQAAAHPTFEDYIEKSTPKTNDPMSINWWSHRSKYMVSLLKAFFGDAATKENNFGYDWLPKAKKPVPHIVLFEDMLAGQHQGCILMGTNPLVGGPGSERTGRALENLDWLVAMDIFETDTSIFWKRPGANPKNINTEVFLLPAAASVEKEGSVSNSGRWAQWRYTAQPAPGDALTDLDFLDMLIKELKVLYAEEGGKVAEPILNSYWNFTPEGETHPCPRMVAREINGFDWKTGKLLPNFVSLKDDGSTISGNWLYSGQYTEDGNMTMRRGAKDASNKIGLYPEWSWCWPVNRRILYNRASVDRDGKPFDPDRWVVKWDGKGWKGDVIDGGPTAGPKDKNPFIMVAEGVAKLFAPTGLADGPLTEHFEAMESPARNTLNSQGVNPATLILDSVKNDFGTAADYPYVGTSYRVVEHWQAGAMTRNMPWLIELVPDMFCEISPSLAEKKGISNGDPVVISSKRGEIRTRALVTNRVQPWKIHGKDVEMVGMIWHFGHGCEASGASCNVLTGMIGDPNTMIPEYKTFLVDIEKSKEAK